MLLFWEHGYEATSISDLTHALQLTAPSLYSSFGDKTGLFISVLTIIWRMRHVRLKQYF
jgi:AcrR family transcriptional regulator